MTTQKRAASSNAENTYNPQSHGGETLAQLLLRNASQRGARAAYREKRRGIWHTQTWAEFANEVAALAAGLETRGVARGSYVAFMGDNRPRLYAAIGAAHRLGAVAVPLFQDATADEIEPLLKRSGATHIFVENQEQVDKILKILPNLPSLRCIVYDKDRGMRHYEQKVLVSYTNLLKDGNPAQTPKADGSAEDPAFIFFTSGTSDTEKGVVLTHAAMLDRARASIEADGISESDTTLAYLPPGWIGQIQTAYVQPLVAGLCVACPESSETVFSDMREIGPTYLLATPRVLETLHAQVSLRLADSSGFNKRLYEACMGSATRASRDAVSGKADSAGGGLARLAGNFLIYGPLRDVLGMSRLRLVYAAGDAISPELLTFYRAIGVNIKQIYGSTETGFFVCIQRNGEVHADAVGVATRGVELSFGKDGEILVRSPGLLQRYHDGKGAASVSADGWFHTGDVGYLDDAGQLRITERLNDISTLQGGALFAPKQVGNHLKFSPYINEAVVFGAGEAFAVALLDIDMTSVSAWADRQGIAYTGQADLASREEVYGLIGAEIARANAEIAGKDKISGCQVRRFAILPKEFDADDGLLTRTGKPRRHTIADRFRALIAAMFAGKSEAAGASGETLRIGDAPPSGTTKTKKAA